MNIIDFRKLRESVEYDLSGLLDKVEDRIDALETEVQAKEDKLEDVQEDLDLARDEVIVCEATIRQLTDTTARLIRERDEAEQRYRVQVDLIVPAVERRAADAEARYAELVETTGQRIAQAEGK